MELIEVRNELTLEILGETIDVFGACIYELSCIPPRDDEKSYYASIESQIDALSVESFGTSRQLLVQNQECISSIQILRGRKTPTMMVFMRSSDSARISSDLGFLARMAIKTGVVKIEIKIGSFHTKI